MASKDIRKQVIGSFARLPVEILVLFLPALSRAVSLADFSPKCTGLTPSCQSVYDQAIPGCSATDFSSGTCSPSCISGMFTMNDVVFDGCSGAPKNNQNVIQQFILGKGVQVLCPNAQISTGYGGGAGLYGTTLLQSQASVATSAAPLPPVVATTQQPQLPQSTNIPSPSNEQPRPPPPTPSTILSSNVATSVLVPSSTLNSPSTYIPPPSVPSTMSSSERLMSSLSTPSISLTTPSSSSSPMTTADPSSSSTTTHTPTIDPNFTSVFSMPFNNPPTALIGTNTLSMLPSPTINTSGVGDAVPQQTGCVPNGGGGSLIGDRGCQSSSASLTRGEWKWIWGCLASVGLGGVLVML